MADEWISCSLGHQHRGAAGAAGLYLVAAGRLLLVEHGETASSDHTIWGLPTDTRNQNENAQRAALRAASHTVGLDPAKVLVFAEFVDNHGGWTDTTIMARAAQCLNVSAGQSATAEWVVLHDVSSRNLDPSLAAHLPALQKLFDESAPG